MLYFSGLAPSLSRVCRERAPGGRQISNEGAHHASFDKKIGAIAALALPLLITACASDNDTDVAFSTDPLVPVVPEDSGPAVRLLAGEGVTLYLARIDSNQTIEIDSASIPSTVDEELKTRHTIFSAIKHPTRPWVYTTSFIHYDWGNGRIDRFNISSDSIDYAGMVFKYDDSGTASSDGQPASCASPEDESGFYGGCAPVSAVFSADGTRLYIQDDNDDLVQVFAVNLTSGALTFIGEGDNTSLHGLAKHPTLPYLYNGSTTYDVTGDDVVTLVSGDDGNDTTFYSAAAGDFLYSTVGTSGLAVYGLTDPQAPGLVESIEIGSNQARAVAMNAEHNRLVTVGRNTVATVGFDGETMTELDRVTLAEGFNVENREVALTPDGQHAFVAWFRSDDTPSGWSGGFSLYGIAADGSLTSLETVTTEGIGRIAEIITVD